jgi:ABC-2 type transport system permease protein
MSNVLLVAGRELKAYVRSPLGYIAAAAALLIDGILFMTRALGDAGGKRLSAKVLEDFFFNASGVTMILGVVLSMRLLAQEHESGTLVLLRTSPVSDRSVIVGKFLAVLAVLMVITGLTLYMPALIFVNGKVSVGHILVGYLGLILLGAATMSVGIFSSAIAKNQVIAAILATAIMGALLLMWLLARISDAPVDDFINGLAIHHLRQRDFMTGVLHLDNVVYYLAMTYFFLFAATKTLEARRWQ